MLTVLPASRPSARISTFLSTFLHRLRSLASAAEAAALCTTSRPELAVVALPHPALSHFATHAPHTRLVVLGTQHEPGIAERALQVGALAFVDRHEAPAHLPLALASARRGERYTSPLATQTILAHVAHPATAPTHGDAALLSPREQDIFAHMAQGRGPKTITSRLGLSIKTIGSHQETMKGELHVPTMAALRQRAEKWLAGEAMWG